MSACCMTLWPLDDSKAVRIALCVIFCFVQASTETTSFQQLLILLSVTLNVLFCFVFHIPVPIIHYFFSYNKCTINYM